MANRTFENKDVSFLKMLIFSSPDFKIWLEVCMLYSLKHSIHKYVNKSAYSHYDISTFSTLRTVLKYIRVYMEQ